MLDTNGGPEAGAVTNSALTHVVSGPPQFAPSELIDYGSIGEMTAAGTTGAGVDNGLYS